MAENGSEIQFKGCGAVIKEWRENAKLSVREFAKLAGCDGGRISKIENDQLSISLTMIEQVAAEMGVQSELIVLKCLESRFPKMRSTEAGRIVAKYLSPKTKG